MKTIAMGYLGPGEISVRSEKALNLVTYDNSLTICIYNGDNFLQINGTSEQLLDIAQQIINIIKESASENAEDKNTPAFIIQQAEAI